MNFTERLWGDEKFDRCEETLIHGYKPEKKSGDGAVIIFAGGGYGFRAFHESEPYALELNRMGIWAFVVDYRVAPCNAAWPLLDAMRAIRLVRERARDYNINPEKIAVMGSSAGGHLAASVSTIYDENNLDSMPNAQILCYPVTDIESHRGSYETLLGNDVESYKTWCPISNANKHTPPAFIWHTSCDSLVDVKGTYRYATRLSELGVPVEMHIYPVGDHGLGLAKGLYGSETLEYVQRWTEDLEHWLRLLGWINE